MKKEETVIDATEIGAIYCVTFKGKKKKTLTSFYTIKSYQTANIANIIYQPPGNDKHLLANRQSCAPFVIFRPFVVNSENQTLGHPSLLTPSDEFGCANLLIYSNCIISAIEKMNASNWQKFTECALHWETTLTCPHCKTGQIHFKGAVFCFLNMGVTAHCANCKKYWRYKMFELIPCGKAERVTFGKRNKTTKPNSATVNNGKENGEINPQDIGEEPIEEEDFLE